MNNASVNRHYSEEKYKLYKCRAIIFSVFLSIALGISIFLGLNIVKKEVTLPINYTDSGTIDYRVYLVENEFYTEQFLPKGQSYVTSLIDYIDINYGYLFNIDELANINFEYKIMGDLIIENNSNKKQLLRKTYEIVSSKEKNLINASELSFNEKFQINYSYYNQLANQFRSTLGVDTNSYLKVYLSIKKDSSENEKYSLHQESNINEIIIPLSEKAIEINIDSKNNEETKQIMGSEKIVINYINIIIIAIIIIASLFFVKKIVDSIKKMKRKRSNYDKYVNKLLKEYDRLIVETKTILDLKKYNIVKVGEFTELLDVRDNLKIPINYYCIEKHVKGLFYIKSDNDIYVLYVDTDLLEKD